jgi:hypothetical protein
MRHDGRLTQLLFFPFVLSVITGGNILTKRKGLLQLTGTGCKRGHKGREMALLALEGLASIPRRYSYDIANGKTSSHYYFYIVSQVRYTMRTPDCAPFSRKQALVNNFDFVDVPANNSFGLYSFRQSTSDCCSTRWFVLDKVHL